jgi:hypothetical protein
MTKAPVVSGEDSGGIVGAGAGAGLGAGAGVGVGAGDGAGLGAGVGAGTGACGAAVHANSKREAAKSKTAIVCALPMPYLSHYELTA